MRRPTWRSPSSTRPSESGTFLHGRKLTSAFPGTSFSEHFAQLKGIHRIGHRSRHLHSHLWGHASSKQCHALSPSRHKTSFFPAATAARQEHAVGIRPSCSQGCNTTGTLRQRLHWAVLATTPRSIMECGTKGSRSISEARGYLQSQVPVSRWR